MLRPGGLRRNNRKRVASRAVTATILALICSVSSARSQSLQRQTLAGSNFIWYDIDTVRCTSGLAPAARDKYAVVSGYGTSEGRARVDAILEQMRQRGQQIIALGLFHQHGGFGKTILDSSGGTLTLDAMANFVSLVKTIVKLKFHVLYLRFFPSGMNFIPVFGEHTLKIEPGIYHENLLFIENTLNLIKDEDIEVMTDLCNECSPSSAAFDDRSGRLQERLMVYTRQLWRDYVGNHSPTRTVGFSIIPDKYRIANLPMVYELGGVKPEMLDLHFYPSTEEVRLLSCRAIGGGPDCEAARECSFGSTYQPCKAISAGSLFDSVSHQLDAIHFSLPWVIGETHYNDATSASYIKMGIAETHHNVRYIFQWPLRRSDGLGGRKNACSASGQGGGVDVGAPIDIAAYLNAMLN